MMLPRGGRVLPQVYSETDLHAQQVAERLHHTKTSARATKSISKDDLLERHASAELELRRVAPRRDGHGRREQLGRRRSKSLASLVSSGSSSYATPPRLSREAAAAGKLKHD